MAAQRGSQSERTCDLKSHQESQDPRGIWLRNEAPKVNENVTRNRTRNRRILAVSGCAAPCNRDGPQARHGELKSHQEYQDPRRSSLRGEITTAILHRQNESQQWARFCRAMLLLGASDETEAAELNSKHSASTERN